MTLRITRVNEGTRLRLEGRLVAQWAELLEREAAELLVDDDVVLDLAAVGFVDRAGVEVLQRLSRAGVTVLCRPGPVASVLQGARVNVRLDPGEEPLSLP